jgi:hypothetical protein
MTHDLWSSAAWRSAHSYTKIFKRPMPPLLPPYPMRTPPISLAASIPTSESPRNILTKYNTIVRPLTHAFHKLLELLRHASFTSAWKWLCSDLNSWIYVLNKFDTILQDIITEYSIDTLQLTSFTPVTKCIICGVLRFERLLLENSINHKMFNSYDVSLFFRS